MLGKRKKSRIFFSILIFSGVIIFPTLRNIYIIQYRIMSINISFSPRLYIFDFRQRWYIIKLTWKISINIGVPWPLWWRWWSYSIINILFLCYIRCKIHTRWAMTSEKKKWNKMLVYVKHLADLICWLLHLQYFMRQIYGYHAFIEQIFPDVYGQIYM